MLKFFYDLIVRRTLLLCSMLCLVGCASLANFLISAQGTVFLNALGAGGSLIPGVNVVLLEIDGGLALVQSDVDIMCYALPWAQGALVFFEPELRLNPAFDTDEKVAYQVVMAYCSAPPSDVQGAVQALARMYLVVMSALNGQGVPVAIPLSAKPLMKPDMLTHPKEFVLPKRHLDTNHITKILPTAA
jgi:hypothetical protein